MSKRKSQQKKIEQVSILDNIKPYQRYILLVVLIIIPIIIFLSPYLFEGKDPAGSDVVGSKGNTHLYLEYSEKSGETVLWNPNIFGGLPIYNRISPTSIHIDFIIQLLSNIIRHFFWYFLLGGIGLFLFLRQIKIPWYAAVIVAVAFTMLPDWQALFGHGHFSKLRAIMVLPWVLFSFDYFIEKKSWLSTGLFALAFSWFVRTQHYQIVFYGILILLFLYTYPVVKLIINKKYKEFITILAMFVVAIVLTVMTAAQPVLSTYEYAEYSTRGGNPVQLDDEAESATSSGGVSFEYATRWSLAPREIIDFFIPRFTGGTSGETYDGDEYPQLKGQQVPGYWGQMPFTENYDAMGMILFLFAVFGFLYYRKKPFVITLGVFIVFGTLLALGRHFPFLYNIFYENVPFFAKFRVPVMMVNIVFLATFILSGFGLKALFDELKANDYKLVLSVFGGGLIFLAFMLIMKNSFEYVNANELGRYNQQTLDVIKGIRKEFLTTDTIRVMIFVFLTGVIVTSFVFRKVKKEVAVFGVLLLVAVEIFTISNRQISKQDYVDETQLEQNAFKETSITKILQSDSDHMRAIAVSKNFQSNYYAYFYPTINGYSAIKLQDIQDIIEHNLFEFPTQDGLNWNVINMMNGKYIISQNPLPYPFLNKLTQTGTNGEILYRNNNVLPKAWFAKTIKSFNSPENLVLYMNDTSFNPDSLALVVNPDLGNKNYSGLGDVELTNYTPNEIELNISTETEQFLVLSEVYYPEGWTAITSDGKELSIQKTNHILRGINIPAGTYSLTLTFEPATYFTGMRLVWIGNILILLIIAFSAFLQRRKSDT